MSAEVHPFLPDDRPEEDAPPVDLHGERSVYLDAYLAPFAKWLARDTVTEIIVNRPGEVWIEDAAHPGMQKVPRPDIDDRLIQRLAEQVARVSHQGINREHPLLGANATRRRPRPVLRPARIAQALGDGDPPPPPARSAARRLRRGAFAESCEPDASRSAGASYRVPSRSHSPAQDDSDLGWNQHRQNHFPQCHARRNIRSRTRGAG